MKRAEYIAVCIDVADTFAQTYLKMFHGEMTEADADALFMRVLLEQKVPADTEFQETQPETPIPNDHGLLPFQPYLYWEERIQSMFSDDAEKEAFGNWFEERTRKIEERRKAEAEAWEHARQQRKAKLLAEYRAKHPKKDNDAK